MEFSKIYFFLDSCISTNVIIYFPFKGQVNNNISKILKNMLQTWTQVHLKHVLIYNLNSGKGFKHEARSKSWIGTGQG